MKKSKIFVTMLLYMLLTTTLFAGCGKKSEPQPSGDTISDVGNTEQTNTGTKNTANNKKQPEIAVKFANALCDEDYQTILDMLYLPENNIVSATDIQAFLQRSNLSGFLGSDYIEVTDANEDETSTLCYINSKNDKCEIDFVKNENGDLALQMSQAYIEKDLLAPGNASVRINGISLDSLESDYATQYEKGDKGLVMYHLICPVTDFTAHVSSTIVDYDIDVPYNTNAEFYSVLSINLDEETLQNTCNGTKQTLNNMIKDIQAGKTNTNELTQYFDQDIDQNTMNSIINWAANLNVSEDFQFETILPSDKENEECYLVTNNSIRLFTRIKTTWTSDGAIKDSHTYSNFIMTLDKGTWKIKDSNLPKVGGFICNSFTKDWQE